MDQDNPVVALCSGGMRAEAEGRDAEARALFQRAWDAATDDFDACVAAHYLARHQPTTEDTLRWNELCLDRADRVGDERVKGFYASLHANLGRCHHELGHPVDAVRHYRLAAGHLSAAPEGPYREWLRYSIADGLRRLDAAETSVAERPLAGLVEGLCERRDLRALCLLLPAYYGDLGTPADAERLATAARMLHAERRLPAAEQQALNDAVTAMST